MKKRVYSVLLAALMLLSITPGAIGVNAIGDGSDQSPYQIGDAVINDGSAEPTGKTVDNSHWVRTADVPAGQTTVCTKQEHDHAASGCAAAGQNVECDRDDHISFGALATYEHDDGRVCNYDAAQDKWFYFVEEGYACGLEEHTHTAEADCFEATEAYTIWTLTADEAQDNNSADSCVEGCTLEAGHDGDCVTDAPADGGQAILALNPLADDGGLTIHYFLASPGDITDPEGSYINYYGPNKSLNTWPASYAVSDIKTREEWAQIFTQQGIRNVYDESVVTQYVASWPTGYNETTFKDFGSVTIRGTTYSDEDYEIKWVSIMCRNNDLSDYRLNCNQRSFDGEHIHIDGLLVEKIQPGEMEVYKSIPAPVTARTDFSFTLQKLIQPDLLNPPTSANNVDTSFGSMTLTASIPAGETEARIVGGSEISFGYYKLTENSSNGWQNAGIVLTDSRGNSQTVDSDTLYICIAPNGTVQYSTNVSGPYYVMNHVSVQNERKPLTVTYDWKVYNTDGTYTDLPAGAPSEPAAASQPYGSDYVYNTSYVTGTSFYDYDNGLLYTFHGWDTYSHSSIFDVDPTNTGYYELDDGDTNAANNKTVSITADTYIYGFWTVSELPAASAHIAIEKKIVGLDNDAAARALAEKVWFKIDPGIDKDGDGVSRVDVDYGMIAATGEYKLPVYQYDKPYVFVEQDYSVPGYNCVTTIEVTGDHIVSHTENGVTATVAMDPVYEGENVHLGTVTYTNTYTKITGTPVSEYPELYLLKSASDAGLQPGVEFTMYIDEVCTVPVAGTSVFTTNENGALRIDLANYGTGTYYLKETKALSGYIADSCVYKIVVSQSKVVEELRDGKYVVVTYYTAAVTVPEGSTAVYDANALRLHIYNEPVKGTLNINKVANGLDDNHKDELTATVIVHGPLTYSGNTITDIGSTWTLTLDKSNNWAADVSDLPVGDYLIHESFASVHGYEWDSVTYGGLQTGKYYNDIESAKFTVSADNTQINLTITNTYVVWDDADFYIKKVAEDSGAALAGAEFTLYSNLTLTDEVAVKTTGADGFAHFDGFTVASGATATYYLRETVEPNGYYLSDTVYVVEITHNTNGYDISITPNGTDGVFDHTTDLLTVTNKPVKGTLTVTKNAQVLDENAQNLAPMSAEDKAKLNITAIVHGPITRDRNRNIIDIGNTWTLTLNSANGLTASISDLPVGEYLIHESFASVHGYTWQEGVTKYNSSLPTVTHNGITSYVFRVSAGSSNLNIEITNTFKKWDAADFYIKKVAEGSGAALAGAEFTLYSNAALTDEVAVKTTGADGFAHFDGFEVDSGKTATYYLKETKAPDGYYLSGTVYKIVISHDNNGYDITVTAQGGTDGMFDHSTDLLTVTNKPVKGTLTITKEITSDYAADNGIPEGLRSITVTVTDGNGHAKNYVLDASNNWKVTLTELPLGTYTVNEQNASVPGYDYTVTYNGSAGNKATVKLEETNKGQTTASPSGAVEIVNAYTRNQETYEIPTSITVKKVGEDGTTPLPGAEFTLTRKSDGHAVSFTTNANGIVVFDLLSGNIDDNGKPVNEVYTLAETKAPEHYHATSTTWTVTIKEDNGELRVELNEEKNVFENFWDWVVGNVEDSSTWENGVLTVKNVKKRGELVISKAVVDPENKHSGAEYSFTVTLSDRSEPVTFTLKNGKSHTIKDIPYGTTYSVVENATGAAYTSAVSDPGNGTVAAEKTTVAVTNTYKYVVNNPGLNLLKVDAETGEPIKGAEFTIYSDSKCTDSIGVGTTDADGKLSLTLPYAAATYYLKETAPAAGYHANGTVYTVVVTTKDVVKSAGTANAYIEQQLIVSVTELGNPNVDTANAIKYTYTVENTAIKPVQVKVVKVWKDEGYHARPTSVDITLYRNGEVYDTKAITAEDNWTYTWTGLTDEYTWTVDEVNVPDGYTKSVANEGGLWSVTNTRVPKEITISVTKSWKHNGGKDMPEDMTVTLYKDGKVYETKTLSEENDWTYTWTGLTDVSVWSVDETEVPAGYTKEITVDGYDFTITNTRTINPVQISVSKVWYGTGVTHPKSVKVTLYRDGKAYDTVTLSANNSWTHTWMNLTDEYEWTVDEPNVPDGYYKTVSRNGNSFTISNTLKDIPKTGDEADMLSWGLLCAFATTGTILTGLYLMMPRKKGKHER